jgi:transmembrane sensor
LIAATFAVMTVGAVAYWELFGRADSYRTDLGEQRTVHLNDGSVLQLNTRSRVRVAFNKRAREIDLEGEALFAVAPDTQRPFVVRTHDATVRAIGTEFNVYEQEGSTRVTVLEGRVEVSASSFGQPFELGSGEAARVTRDTTHKEPNANVKAATAWQSRTLVFERARLADVAHEFNRYNRMQFRIDAALGDSSRLSGTFDARHPESLVLWLQSRPDLTVTREGDAYRVQQVAAHE